MAQGWTIDSVADTLTFFEAPANGAAIVALQNPAGGTGGSDVWAVGAWSPRYGYPSEVEFYSDRLFFAGTPSDPQTIWASCIGDYVNFGRSSPMVDNDSLTYAINARQVNSIKELIPLDSLLAMTTGGEYKITGGADEVVTPSTVTAKPQGSYGSGDVPSRVIGDSAIFFQEEGQRVRDMAYTFEKDGFRGKDLTVWADHLFIGYSFTWIEYWKAPWQVLWFVRDDGVRVGCTYMAEQEVVGFHWHDTDGKYLDACALPGKKESECYYLVERFIDGEVVQCMEQQASTIAETESDLFFVDCGLTYDGRNGSPATLTITTAGGWTEDDELTVTVSAPLFVGTSDEGDGFEVSIIYQVAIPGGFEEHTARARLVIDEYVSATVVKAHSIGSVPLQLRGVPTSAWTLQRDTIDNLWHLEGKMVSILQDAAVVGPLLVENGKVQLATPGGVVHLGLGYTMEVETLELNAVNDQPMRDQNKLAYAVSILLLASRGVKAGGIEDKLYPIKERRFENYGQPPFLKTGIFDANIPAGWGDNAGRVRIVSDDPLPCEILNITTKAASSNKGS